MIGEVLLLVLLVFQPYYYASTATPLLLCVGTAPSTQIPTDASFNKVTFQQEQFLSAISPSVCFPPEEVTASAGIADANSVLKNSQFLNINILSTSVVPVASTKALVVFPAFLQNRQFSK